MNIMLRMAIVSTAILSIFVTTALSQSGWYSQSSGTTNDLYSVSFTDANTGTAVGWNGTILRTTNGGTTWTSQSSGTTNTLWDVSFTDVNTGTAVGWNGTILRTTNGGATWTSQSSGTTYDLFGVSFVDANTGTAVGIMGIIIRTTNGGATWTSQEIGPGFWDVCFTDANTGTAVGLWISRTTDGGVTWTSQSSDEILTGVSFSDANTGTAVGNSGGIIRTTNGGTTWTTQSSGTTNGLHGVCFTDANTGTVVGDQGTILRTTDGGATWTSQTSGTTNHLYGVSFTDPNTGTAVGYGGTILRTTKINPLPIVELLSPNGGETWDLGSLHLITWTYFGITDVKIELSTDAGSSWSTIISSTPAATGNYNWTIRGPSSNQCKVRLSDASNAAINDVTPGLFSIIEYVLQRQIGGGSYEPYQLSNHAWQFANGVNNMWPYSHGILCFGEDVIWCWDRLRCEDVFPSWDLFSRAFGATETYIVQNGNLVRKPSAVERWNSLKGCWGGSCFGFAVSSFLFFDNDLSVSGKFPGRSSLYDVPIQDDSRTLVNTYFIYQFGRSTQDHRNAAWRKTPLETLNEIKQMILDNNRNDQVLSFWNIQNGSPTGGHTVNPYKVELDPLNPSLEYVYIYDNNHPNDATKKIEIRTDLNTWSYSDLGWSGNHAFLLEEPVESFLRYPNLSKNLFQKDLRTGMISAQTSYIEIYNSVNASILITDSGKTHSIGYSDSVAFSDFPDGVPIIPTTGGFQPPIGYYLPKGKYSVQMQAFRESTVTFSVFTDSLIYTYSRHNADSSDTDYLEYGNSLTIANHDNPPKNVKLEATVVGDSVERVFRLDNTPLSQNDSLKVDIEDKSKMKIVNFGTDKAYDLKLQLVSANGDSIFEHRRITLPTNSTHQIVPQWDSVSNKAVKILIDSGNTGSINDSMFAENRLFNFSLSERWNIVSLPLNVDDPHVSFLYPAAISRAFAYNPGSGYAQQDTLRHGPGYWLKMQTDQVVTMYGIPITSDTINVIQGWNLIGSATTAVPTLSIRSNPPGMITSNFFKYAGTYSTTDTIFPGRGYWVKVSQDGSIVLSSNFPTLAATRIRIVPTSELPPPPPTETNPTSAMPKAYALEQNYPNPFNPATIIRYQLPVDSKVTLKIYNLLGQEIMTLVDEIQTAGHKSVEWNTVNIATGVYLYRLVAGSFVETKKLVLLR